MTILLRNLPVPVVNDQFGLLIAANFARAIHRFLLGLCVFDGPFATAYFYIPATIARWNYVM